MEEKLYIRIGDIPLNEISLIYRGDAIIGEEKGVSVYNAALIDNKWHVVLPTPMKEGKGLTFETLIQDVTQCRFEIENPRKIYLVKGTEIGKGSDNEPLIKNVEIIDEITNQFI